MRPSDTIPLGAPGVVFVPERPLPTPLGVPMHECAFVGVTPRGPAWALVEGDDGPVRVQAVAVAVRSWDDYRRQFGAFEGPGLLPLAVSAFFEQGGAVAHVVRVVHREPGRAPVEPPGRAHLPFGNAVRTTTSTSFALSARDEGSWGDRLEATLSFTATVLPLERPLAVGRELVTGAAPLAGGAVVRITSDDGARRLRVVETSIRRLSGERHERVWVAMLDQPVPGVVTQVELVEATLEVVDHDPALERRERFEHAGLMPAHPRWLGDLVRDQSRLVELVIEQGAGLRPDVELLPVAARAVTGSGTDRYEQVRPDDVMGAGVAAALAVPTVALLCVPDLYAPGSLPERDDVLPPATVAGSTFAECHPLRAVRQASEAPPPRLPLLRLDPEDHRDLELITERQVELVAAAEAAGVVALMDVPPRLPAAAVLRWRRCFTSSYAAAYHPWLRLPRDGASGCERLVDVPPSAIAAGIIARAERTWGLPKGPANEVARGVPDVSAQVAEAEHGELHWSNVNVFVMAPEGVLLTGARTLSNEQSWRQLTARRIVSMVERAVAQQLQWLVFEPNTARTRRSVVAAVENLLHDLFRAGAFRGATPDACFFVRTAAGPALVAEQDAATLLCEIGLAPAEPLEFLLVRVHRDGDATLRTESRRA